MQCESVDRDRRVEPCVLDEYMAPDSVQEQIARKQRPSQRHQGLVVPVRDREPEHGEEKQKDEGSEREVQQPTGSEHPRTSLPRRAIARSPAE